MREAASRAALSPEAAHADHDLAEDAGFELMGLIDCLYIGASILILSPKCRFLTGTLCYNLCYKLARVWVIKY